MKLIRRQVGHWIRFDKESRTFRVTDLGSVQKTDSGYQEILPVTKDEDIVMSDGKASDAPEPSTQFKPEEPAGTSEDEDERKTEAERPPIDVAMIDVDDAEKSEHRPRLTPEQVAELEQGFLKNPKPSTEHKHRLADELDVTIERINVSNRIPHNDNELTKWCRIGFKTAVPKTNMGSPWCPWRTRIMGAKCRKTDPPARL